MLFLFDIDGTLLYGMPPAHRMALCDAAGEIYGVKPEPRQLGKTAGLTDSVIARRMLVEAGVPPEEIVSGLQAFYAAAADAYGRHVPSDLRPYHTPHVTATLDWLRGRGATLALVTGNIERIAWRKLAAAGLDAYFALGAFGDEAESRDELPPKALDRAEQRAGHGFSRDNVYVIGDTPADIACGANSQLRTIAVATGPDHSLAELLTCGPDFAVQDLGEFSNLPLFGETDANTCSTIRAV
jgi:phosphoglycolate phosphatase